MTSFEEQLVGIGLYTPAEAEVLIGVSSRKIIRWLRGHVIDNRRYDFLWNSQVDLKDGKVYLGFRDLMEVRVVNAFIERGLSPQRVRKAIALASEILGVDRPLSTAMFRTDGRSVFLQVLREDGADELMDLFQKQYAFREIIEPSFKNVEFNDEGLPYRWWPHGRSAHIVVDPLRAFGRPIEATSGIPASVLAAAAKAEGSNEAAARVWKVPISVIRNAVEFDRHLRVRDAA